MGNLVLGSLEITNFRAFSHLKIERLGRVNLITGKNNVGKTCLLEALRLYASDGSPNVILDILNSRLELQILFDKPNLTLITQNLRHLAHGSPSITDLPQRIEIGPPSSKRLTLTLDRREGSETRFGPHILRREKDEPIFSTTEIEHLFSWSYLVPTKNAIGINCQYIPTINQDASQISDLWDQVTFTESEERIIEALKIILPEVQRIGFIGEKSESSHRIPVIKIKDKDGPIPLKNLGEGIVRLFGIMLALVNAKDGLLLLDEIENGLHYSIMPDVWRVIFRVAHDLNVQVFATTHSWDCIEAFEKAASEAQEEEGVIVRLQNKGGQIVATSFEEEEISIITREMIEVR